jgi:Holliday junction DNA helicase RuvA
MIGRLRGIVIEKNTDHLVIDVGGVGYSVFTHQRLMSALNIDSPATLSIETHVREDHIHLFGFADSVEREWFRALLSVERVGAKMALNILNALLPSQIFTAVLAKDTSAFSQISGVGPKLAERIIIEMKDKALKLPVSGDVHLALASPPAVAAKTTKGKAAKEITPTNGNMQAGLIEDATSALVNMGYSRSDALTRIMQAVRDGKGETLDSLITASLRKAS